MSSEKRTINDRSLSVLEIVDNLVLWGVEQPCHCYDDGCIDCNSERCETDKGDKGFKELVNHVISELFIVYHG